MKKLPRDLVSRSLSANELVFSIDDALRALSHLEAMSIPILGWEAWILGSDGRVGHPPTVIGSGDLKTDPDPIGFCRVSIRDAKTRWDGQRHRDGREIYFCITTGPA